MVFVLKTLTFLSKTLIGFSLKVNVLRTKAVPLVKVLWQYHDVEEATWETKERMRDQYPEVFTDTSENFEEEIFFRRGECGSPKLDSIVNLG